MFDNHQHQDCAQRWFAGIHRFATCPITEGALARYAMRNGGSAPGAIGLTRKVRNWPGCEFWPDSLPYSEVPVGHVTGYRQLTDAYLVALAASHPDAKLATLDKALAASLPEQVFLIPE
jgi:predicted nucleic acid-binding protein